MSAERLDAARTCLLLFDFLVGHASKDPKRYAPVLANAAKLLAAARAAGAIVAYARADQNLLLRLAAGRFAAKRSYTEAEVNEILRGWLATFCAPYGIDHVSMRRYLVDARLLARDTAGSTYRRAAPAQEADADPAQVLAEIRRERAARKRQHAP